MGTSDERIQLLHPDPTKSAPRISRRAYELMRKAMLQVISPDGPGLRFLDLAGEIEKRLSPGELGEIGSLGWYTTTVKLDLEARGLIERVPGVSPQRLRRVRKE